MRIAASCFVFILAIYCVTETHGFSIGKIRIKFPQPDFPFPFPTIWTLPKIPSIPPFLTEKANAETATIETTSTTTTTPTTITMTPTPTISPSPETPEEVRPHPYDDAIEACLASMKNCEWTPEELAEKIIERDNVDPDIEYTGEGDGVGPEVDPNDIADGFVEPTSRPGEPPIAANRIVPDQCLVFGEKSASTRDYRINCSAYLEDTTLRYHYQRRNAMVGCFKCRNLCELAGRIQYL